MNSDWQAFLQSRSATADSERLRLPYAGELGDFALFDLSHLGVIEVAGPEAVGFLQGQVTNDVRAATAEHSHLSAHLTPKGRILSLFRVVRTGEEALRLVLPRPVVPALHKRLSMFRLRAKVDIRDLSDQLVTVGLAGERAPAELAARLPAVPEADNGVAADGDVTAVRIPGPLPRFLLIAPPDAMKLLWTALADGGAGPADADAWALLDIRAGLPQVFPETADAFVPQMVNLQLIDGVSFTKGCYTGQEVVARMQYLGKLKRRMYLAEVAADAPPPPGQELHAAGGTSEQATGRVVDARLAGPGRVELLAVVETDAVEKREVRLGSPDGPVLSFRELPYGFGGGD